MGSEDFVPKTQEQIKFLEKIKSRKFFFAVCTYVANVVLVAMKIITPEIYATVTGTIILSYLAANVADKFAQGKSPSSTTLE